MSILSSIRDEFIQGRIYLVRGVAYLSLINAGMILFLFLDKLTELGIIEWNVNNYFFPLLFLGFTLLLGIGWFEIKILKGIHREGQINFSYTPQFPNMEKKINDIYAYIFKDGNQKFKGKNIPSIDCAGMRRIA